MGWSRETQGAVTIVLVRENVCVVRTMAARDVERKWMKRLIGCGVIVLTVFFENLTKDH